MGNGYWYCSITGGTTPPVRRQHDFCSLALTSSSCFCAAMAAASSASARNCSSAAWMHNKTCTSAHGWVEMHVRKFVGVCSHVRRFISARLGARCPTMRKHWPETMPQCMHTGKRTERNSTKGAAESKTAQPGVGSGLLRQCTGTWRGLPEHRLIG